MKRKFYEEPSIEILRAESEIWFFNEISPGRNDNEFGGEDDEYGDWE